MTHYVFISHSSKDKAIADAVCASLEAAKISCWIAPRDILPGEKWAESIETAIKNSRVMVLIFSSNSNNSEAAKSEVSIAFSWKVMVIPFRIENIEPAGEMKFYLMRTFWLDALNPPTKEQIQRLVEIARSLMKIEGPGGIERTKKERSIKEKEAIERLRIENKEWKKREEKSDEDKRNVKPANEAVEKEPQNNTYKSKLSWVRKMIRMLKWEHLEKNKNVSTNKPESKSMKEHALDKSSNKSGNPEIPSGMIDQVHFTVTSPSLVRPSDSFVVNIWAHLERQREEVIRRAREAFGNSKIHVISKGPVKLVRGSILSVRLKFEEFLVENSEDTILWINEIGDATFLVTVPKSVAEGPKSGLATIHVNGLQIARIYFIIQVGKMLSEENHIPTQQERNHKAFASYASTDRNDVLARIQGIQKVIPQLDIFLDVVSLRSGQYWEQELWKVIPSNDVFYLFWSHNAAKSQWVEKEWRCALKTRGLDFIDPVPLVAPEKVPPPPELASKHFNDWVLAYMQGKRQ